MNEQVLKKSDHVVSLASAAVLVEVAVSMWTASVRNKRVSNETCLAKKADIDSGDFIQKILGRNHEHKDLLNHRQTVYNWIQRLTYPWAGSTRLLPAIDLIEFRKQYDHLYTIFETKLESFLKIYPTLINNMAFAQGDLFDRALYPTVGELRNRFSMKLLIMPVPTNDFRVSLAADLADDLYNNYNRQAGDVLAAANEQQVQALVTVLESLSHCCDVEIVTNEDGTKKVKRRKIYDSTIERALQLCNSFKNFNPTSDALLEEARGKLELALGTVDPKALKNSDALRAQIKTEVDDILLKFRPKTVAVVEDSEDESEPEQDRISAEIEEQQAEDAPEELVSTVAPAPAPAVEEQEEQFAPLKDVLPKKSRKAPKQAVPEEEEDIRSIIAKYTASK